MPLGSSTTTIPLVRKRRTAGQDFRHFRRWFGRSMRRLFAHLTLRQIFVAGAVLILIVVSFGSWDLAKKWVEERAASEETALLTASGLSKSLTPLLWNMDRNAVDYAIQPLLHEDEIISIAVYETSAENARKLFSQYTWGVGGISASPLDKPTPIVRRAVIQHDKKDIGEVEVFCSLDRANRVIASAAWDALLRTGFLVGLLGFGVYTISRQRAVSMELMSSRNRVKKALAQAKQAQAELEEKHEQILSSIHYGRMIQTALLPKEEELRKWLPQSALLFKPRDIVSGDFYWLAAREGEVFIAVIDCTGHGVPGAFMSMIGCSLLDQIVKVDEEREPAKILTRLDLGVREALRQQSSDSYANDGMDVCLCRIEKGAVTFAGAQRPLYYWQDGKLGQIKGNRLAVGGRARDGLKNFQQHTIFTPNPTTLYLTTDGLIDQPNEQRARFSSRRLQRFLETHGHTPLNRQYSYLLSELQVHQGAEPQRDDITLLAVWHDPDTFALTNDSAETREMEPSRRLIPQHDLA
jgi:serine phosphatase RsbU (regulator of sigma subunit)